MREYEEKDLYRLNEWNHHLSLKGVDGNGNYIYACRGITAGVFTFRSARYGKLIYIGTFRDENKDKKHAFKIVGKDKVLMCDTKGHCVGEGKRGARVRCYVIQFENGDYVSNGDVCGLRDDWSSDDVVWNAIRKSYSWKEKKYIWETCGELSTWWVHESRRTTSSVFWRLCTEEEKQMVKDNSRIKESGAFIRYCE